MVYTILASNETEGFEPSRRFRDLHLSRGASSANLSTFPMAPQVGLEPTTDRLTADSSTTELLWINLYVFEYQAQILL